MDLFKKDEKKMDSVEGIISDNKASDLSLEELEKRRAERYGIAPKKDGRGRKPKSETLQDELVKDLYKPAIWQEVASLPFNIRKAMTGSEIFDLNKDQKEALGAPLAMIMKMLVDIDPKYLALMVFSINLGTIWAEKEILWNMENKRKKTNAKIGA